MGHIDYHTKKLILNFIYAKRFIYVLFIQIHNVVCCIYFKVKVKNIKRSKVVYSIEIISKILILIYHVIQISDNKNMFSSYVKSFSQSSFKQSTISKIVIIFNSSP